MANNFNVTTQTLSRILTKTTFSCQPTITNKTGGVVDTTDAQITIHRYDSDMYLYFSNIAAQSLLVPAANSDGLDYSYDAENDNGIQWCAKDNTYKGILNKDYFTIGTSPAFYMQMTIKLNDVSATDNCAFGFRKVAAFVAAIDDYTDMACLNIISGNINIETILNNTTKVTTDTTQDLADAGSVVLRVNVSNTGVVTYLIDGSAPTTTAAFTFDDTDEVTPFGYHIHAAASSMGIIYKELEFGLQ